MFPNFSPSSRSFLQFFDPRIIRRKKKIEILYIVLSSCHDFFKILYDFVNVKNISKCKNDWNNYASCETLSLAGVRSIEIFGRFFLIYKHATCYTGERERLQRTQGTIFWIMAIWMSKSRSVDGPDGSIELFDK